MKTYDELLSLLRQCLTEIIEHNGEDMYITSADFIQEIREALPSEMLDTSKGCRGHYASKYH